ncbi:MAG: tRNA pseudouridine(55) synthase TruB [Chloroflexota bacterium]|nr:tRNA pseudouridine(55) synthase TruB [Chloroflexota bacterium]
MNGTTQQDTWGLLVVDKDAGLTSHDVVDRVRRMTKIRRVGHSGTLDPMATGVLVLALGKATRLLEYLVGAEKVYDADITLGFTTDTYDAMGQITSEARLPGLSFEQVDSALDSFRGDIMQTPPAFSALKRDGIAMYKRARAGEQVSAEPRPVTVHDLRLLDYTGGRLHLRISCSAGTYIRSIAHDLGKRLGCGGTLTRLRRLAVGDLTIDMANRLDTLSAAVDAGQWTDLLLPAERAIAELDTITLSESDARKILFGQSLDAAISDCTDSYLGAFDPAGKLLAIIRYDEAKNIFRPVKVLAQANG